MCESCDSTPEQRLEFLDDIEKAMRDSGAEIVTMPAWMSTVERMCHRQANKHELQDNVVRYVFWDIMTGVPMMADDLGRRIGLIKGRSPFAELKGCIHGTSC